MSARGWFRDPPYGQQVARVDVGVMLVLTGLAGMAKCRWGLGDKRYRFAVVACTAAAAVVCPAVRRLDRTDQHFVDALVDMFKTPKPGVAR